MKKEAMLLHKNIFRDNQETTSFINRPVAYLNKPELEFGNKNFFMNTTDMILKERKNYLVQPFMKHKRNHLITQLNGRKNNIIAFNQNKGNDLNESFHDFKKRM